MNNLKKFINESTISLAKMRREILEIGFSAKEGHIPSALSILEIIYTIYGSSILKKHFLSSKNINDKFILSKGHASLGLYAVLSELRLIKKKDFISFCKFNSICGGHPDKTKNVNFEVSTGSLGHGLPVAVGLALSYKKKYGNMAPKVFCLIGDGEANEGTTWESLLVARSRSLNNLICIIDFNKSNERALPLRDLKILLKGFSLNIKEISGHSIKEIHSSLTNLSDVLPNIIIANTIKGKGIKVMENNHAWHHKTPSREELDKMLSEII